MNENKLAVAAMIAPLVPIAVLVVIHIWERWVGRRPTQTCYCYCDCGNELCSDGSYIGFKDKNGDPLETFACKKMRKGFNVGF